MSFISELSRTTNTMWQSPQQQINVQFFNLCPASEVVENLAILEGPIHIYCWYEGTQGLHTTGALFMKNSIFAPLFEKKKDTKLYLYSLKGWDFKRNIKKLQASIPSSLEKTINCINQVAIEYIPSSSFFNYCLQREKNKAMTDFIEKEILKKDWLIKLSENRKASNCQLRNLFSDQASLFDSIQEKDCALAYSQMQYIEGYYLIQRSVEQGLTKNQKKIAIAFVLPNNEGQYYLDFPSEIPKMLALDFGEQLKNIEINISFRYFNYGSLNDRPYNNKNSQSSKVKTNDISLYFDYLKNGFKSAFLRDVIHNLNGWN